MKGSDKWGQGKGPRIEIVLAALVVLALLGVYLLYAVGNGLTSGSQAGRVETVSTTGVSCNSAAIPQAAQLVQSDPRFASLSGGACYNYMGENASGGATVFYFNYYNGTIVYPCGTSPQELATSQIQAVVSSSGEVASVQMSDQSSLNAAPPCGPSAPQVEVVSVQDVESTIPAVPQLNVTLAASPAASPIASLDASLTLDGGSQLFQLVSAPSTLAPGHAVSKTEIVLSGVSFSADEVYPMRISGTFANGQAFSYTVHVQVAQVP